MKEFWFSIVVPSYNQGNFIRDCLESVVSQEGDFGIELILMDGHSHDNSRDVWTDFFSKMLGGQYVRKGCVSGQNLRVPCKLGLTWIIESEKDSGQSNALNKGFHQATGHWANWLGTDDLFLPGAFNSIYKLALSKERVNVIYGDVFYETVGISQREVYSPVRPTLFSFIRQGQGLHQTAVFFKMDIFRRYGPLREDLHFSMDKELYQRWLLKGVGFLRIRRILAVQRVHAASKTGSDSTLFGKFRKEEKKVLLEGLRSLRLKQKLGISFVFLQRKFHEYIGRLRMFVGSLRKRHFS